MGKKKPRGNGEGAIYQRPNGTWVGQVTISYDPKTRTAKRKSFSGKSRGEVKDKINKALHDLKEGTYIEPTKMTVEEWLKIWLEEYKKPSLRPTTYESYESMVRNHVNPAIGEILLKSLRPEQLQRLYNDKKNTGLSARTVRYIHQVVHSCLDQAVKNQLLVRNVSNATTLPSGEKKEIRAMTVEEMKRFLKVLEGDRLAVAFVCLLGTGLRRGELLALRWSDVDLDASILHVRRGMVMTKKGIVFQEPKTKLSKRSIPLPDDVVNSLKRYKAAQNKEKLKAGGGYSDQNLVFCTEIGTPIIPRNFNRKFYQLREAAKTTDINLHALRHTYATRLLEQGQHLKVVQELLGHSKIAMTADVYSHVSPQVKKEAVSGLNGMLTVKTASTQE